MELISFIRKCVFQVKKSLEGYLNSANKIIKLLLKIIGLVSRIGGWHKD